MKVDITKLPVDMMVMGFITVALIVTFVLAFNAVEGGDEGGDAVSASPTATGGATPGGDGAGAIEIAAVPVVKFDKSELTVPAGQQVTLRFDNRDTGQIHNWAAYPNRTASQTLPGAKTDLCTGPCLREVTFTAPAAGEYFYKCDVHPQQMTGTMIAR